jgi:hypothetical protein
MEALPRDLADMIQLNANGSWQFLAEVQQFTIVPMYGEAAVGYDGMAEGPGKAAARRILQGIYMGIRFLEMKRHNYNGSVRAPE